MSQSAQDRRESLEATRPAAQDLVRDLEAMRDILARAEYTDEDLKTGSAALARWIGDSEIVAVANIRLSKLRLNIPDYAPYAKADQSMKLGFVGRVGDRVIALPSGAAPVPGLPDPERPPRTAEARMETFRTQSVILMRGQWVSRVGVINYVADFTSHGPDHRIRSDYEGDILALMPHCVQYLRQDDGRYMIRLSFGTEDGPPEPHPVSADVLVSEIWATMRLVVESKDVQKLAAVIRKELAKA